MDRGASAAFITEILKSSNQPIYLVEAWFDDGTIRMSDAWVNVVWGGNTYTANGYFLGFSGLSETSDMTIPNVTVQVSAVDQTWIAIALSKPYIDRRIAVYKAFLDYTQALISSPLLMFDGRIDTLEISDDPGHGSCTIAVSASSQWVDFQRTPGRHTNDDEEQIWYPGDRGFQFVTNFNQQIKWGAA